MPIMPFLPKFCISLEHIVISLSYLLPLLSSGLVLMMFHMSSLHWSLVIICIPDKEDESGPILLHLDSLGLHSSKSVFDNIKR